MKLYTRKGDAGQTDLLGGRRVAKNDARVACYGDVDELNAAIGLAASVSGHDDWRDDLQAIQSDLFIVGAQLATAEHIDPRCKIGDDRVAVLEQLIDKVMADVEPLRNFVLPGGCELAARFHLARTVCRRAERALVKLAGDSSVDPLAITYTNRLSDLLFAFALGANRRAGVDNILWTAPDDS